MEVTYSDIDLSPGEAVTATITFTFTNTSSNNPVLKYSAGLLSHFNVEACTLEPGQTGGCGLVGTNGYRVDVGDVAPGTSTTAVLDLTVRPDHAPGAVALFQQFDADKKSTQVFTPPVTLTIVPPLQEADISVDLAAASRLLSSQVNYTLNIDNNGPGDATGVQVVVDLPTQTTNVTTLPAACTYNSATDEVTCTYSSLTTGSIRAPSFTATMGLLSIGQLPATATRVASSPTDPNPANDTANYTVLTSLIITWQ